MSISKLLLTESYIDNILDKVSSRGIDSLGKYELKLLKLNARKEPDQLIEDWVEYNFGELVEDNTKDGFGRNTKKYISNKDGTLVAEFQGNILHVVDVLYNDLKDIFNDEDLYDFQMIKYFKDNFGIKPLEVSLIFTNKV